MIKENYGILSYSSDNSVPNSKQSETLKNEHHICLDKVLGPINLD